MSSENPDDQIDKDPVDRTILSGSLLDELATRSAEAPLPGSVTLAYAPHAWNETAEPITFTEANIRGKLVVTHGVQEEPWFIEEFAALRKRISASVEEEINQFAALVMRKLSDPNR